MTISETAFDICMRFIRGDMPAKDFESWVYDTSELSSLFSEDFYLDLISLDYTSTGSVFVIKERLNAEIKDLDKRDCHCHALADLATVSMGQHEDTFRSLEQKAKYGEPLWWLWLAQCNQCSQFWLVGSDERINDVFVMKRLSVAASERIKNESIWPEDFKKFETLLSIGKEQGHSARFLDPVSPALVCTVVDLRKARPDIEIEEIADLLQVGLAQTKAIVAKANTELRSKLN